MQFPMNIANMVTAFRIVLTPLLVILLIERKFLLGLLVFLIAAISDGVDGLLARMLRQKTVLGSYLDPIADKLLLSSAYIVLASTGVIPPWLAVVIISRDALILLGVAVLTLFRGASTLQPSILSKTTTLAQILTLLLVLLQASYRFPFSMLPVMFWITAAFTCCSGLHYMYYGLKLLSENEA